MLRSGSAVQSSLVAFVGVSIAIAASSCKSPYSEESSTEMQREAAVAAMPSIGEMPLNDVLWGGPILRGETITHLSFVDDHLFVTTASGSFWAISKNGVPLWSTTQLLEPPVYEPVSNGEVVALVSRGDLFCFDRDKGALRLKRQLTFATSAPPAMTRSTAYIPSWEENRVHAVDLTTGSLGWFYRPRGPVSAAPLVLGAQPREVLYVASEDGVVAAIEATPARGSAGQELWRTPTNGSVTAGLAASDDGSLLIAASEDTFLYGIDRIAGTKRWSFGAGTPLTVQPWVSGGNVYADTGREFVSVVAADGAVRWREPGTFRFLVRNGGQVFALNGDTRVVVFDDGSGKIVGEYELNNYTFFATNTKGDTLYVATSDGSLFALNRKQL